MSLFLQPKISFDDLCRKLHSLIENEYAMEFIFAGNETASNWRTQTTKLITLWGNISPGDMLSDVARSKIVSDYINDREFQERWYSIGVRMANWIEASTDIKLHSLCDFIKGQLTLPIHQTVPGGTLPVQMLSPRVEAGLLDANWLRSEEMFWYVCLIMARMSLEHSKLMTVFVEQSQQPQTKSAIRREAKLKPAEQNN
jgi:hypothetical protein